MEEPLFRWWNLTLKYDKSLNKKEKKLTRTQKGESKRHDTDEIKEQAEQMELY